jgi:protein-S-isoprenylcysteine O-methyltransferase Ste14
MTIWELVFAAGFVSYIVIRGVFSHRTKGTEKVGRRIALREQLALAAVFVGSLLLPAIFLCSHLLDFADYQLPAAIAWIGAGVMVFALWLFWRAHSDLGTNWSAVLELSRDHQLVQHGVYQRVRHPMYSAIFLFSAAQGMMLSNWLAGWGALVAFWLLYAERVAREEQLMLDRFGDQYADYMQRTGRLTPAWPFPRSQNR